MTNKNLKSIKKTEKIQHFEKFQILAEQLGKIKGGAIVEENAEGF